MQWGICKSIKHKAYWTLNSWKKTHTSPSTSRSHLASKGHETVLSLHWKPRIVMMPTLSALVMMTICGAVSDIEIGIMATLSFQCIMEILIHGKTVFIYWNKFQLENQFLWQLILSHTNLEHDKLLKSLAPHYSDQRLLGARNFQQEKLHIQWINGYLFPIT